MNISIRNFKHDDWNLVAEIYRQGLETRNATFETQVPDFDAWIKKFHAHLLWVAVLEHHVVGWAGLQPVSQRKVYDGVAEVTLYIDSKQRVPLHILYRLGQDRSTRGPWQCTAQCQLK